MTECDLDIVIDSSVTEEEQQTLLAYINDIMNSICRDENILETVDFKHIIEGDVRFNHSKSGLVKVVIQKDVIRDNFIKFFKEQLMAFKKEKKKDKYNITLLESSKIKDSNEIIYINDNEARGKIIEFFLIDIGMYYIKSIGINGLGNYFVIEKPVYSLEDFKDLETYILENKTINDYIIKSILCKILSIHKNKIYHCNLNLKTIKINTKLVKTEGEPYITDFGNASVDDTVNSFENDTDFLQIPPHFLLNATNERKDIYAIGIICIIMLYSKEYKKYKEANDIDEFLKIYVYDELYDLNPFLGFPKPKKKTKTKTKKPLLNYLYQMLVSVLQKIYNSEKFFTTDKAGIFIKKDCDLSDTILNSYELHSEIIHSHNDLINKLQEISL